jgi:hypothetical protein
MARQFPALTDDQVAFIGGQHVFFVATAAETGRVNLSPKGMDSLRVAAPDRILWRSVTGSGNETAGHLLKNPRMTLMWCSFDTRPLILRVYGTATAVHAADPGFPALNALFPNDPGARQVYDVTVDLVQTSCGYAVPLMDKPRERDVLKKWSAAKDEAAIRAYWAEKNRSTIDGFPTGMPE